MKRALTGIRATGDLHIGNLLGAIEPALRLQQEFTCQFFIADLHALTNFRDPARLNSNTLDQVATWLAAGFDAQRHFMYRQSDVPLVTELAWYLSCVTGVGLLEKGHSYKDALAKNREVNHAILAYPVLMAADILLYDADVVPVGKDQKQHVEMARDMAGSFNAVFGEGLLRAPTPLIAEEVMLIPGLDGQKMSKSYGNTIPVACTAAELKKLVMSIPTDSTPLEAPKQLDGSLLGQFYTLFSGSESGYRDLGARLAKGGLGWGHAKLELLEVMEQRLKPLRERYNAFRADSEMLERILAQGRERALSIAIPVLDRVRKGVGLPPFRRG
jgi:tryptophanyl-tRNA synthetase